MQALDIPLPTTFDAVDVFQPGYHGNGRADYHNHGSPTFLGPTPNLPSSYGDEDRNTRHTLSRPAPHRRNDSPIVGANPFEGWFLQTGAQNRNPVNTSSPSNSLGEGPSRPKVVGRSFSTPSLTSLPSELGPHDKQHNLHRTLPDSGIRAHDDAGASESGFIISVSS